MTWLMRLCHWVVEGAQKFLDAQPWAKWTGLLNGLLQRACPALLQLPLAQRRHEYYWSADETEWATDVMFRSPEALQRVYPSLLLHAMLAFSSRDVMRFLGHTRLPGAPSGSGGVDVRFQGEVVSDWRERPEGTRVRHSVNENSIKLYDKQGSVLRPVCTINNAREFRIYRVRESDPDGPKSWQRLRRGVVDLPRRAEISHAACARYLTALAEVDSKTPL
ncbi:MAG TPA: hypothetical protein VK137_05110, partial [Planctomycetaceae bacterium]|nr:hypothetical protein [Planctomycetaceae bacterium]